MEIFPGNKSKEKQYKGSKKALSDAIFYAASQYIRSPITGEQTTLWQAAVDRLYKTAIYAESDKDATAAAKVIAERLFGRAPVQKQENKYEIPRVIFAEKGDVLEQITEKAARAEEDPDDYTGVAPLGVIFDDGTEMIVDAEDD